MIIFASSCFFVYYYLIIFSSCASKDKDTYLFLKTETCKDIFFILIFGFKRWGVGVRFVRISQPKDIFFFISIRTRNISEYYLIAAIIILAAFYFGSLDLTFYNNQIFGSIYHRLVCKYNKSCSCFYLLFRI